MQKNRKKIFWDGFIKLLNQAYETIKSLKEELSKLTEIEEKQADKNSEIIARYYRLLENTISQLTTQRIKAETIKIYLDKLIIIFEKWIANSLPNEEKQNMISYCQVVKKWFDESKCMKQLADEWFALFQDFSKEEILLQSFLKKLNSPLKTIGEWVLKILGILSVGACIVLLVVGFFSPAAPLHMLVLAESNHIFEIAGAAGLIGFLSLTVEYFYEKHNDELKKKKETAEKMMKLTNTLNHSSKHLFQRFKDIETIINSQNVRYDNSNMNVIQSGVAVPTEVEIIILRTIKAEMETFINECKKTQEYAKNARH